MKLIDKVKPEVLDALAESKIKFFDTFGIKTTYAGGGIVGIDRMTRSLREF